VRWILDLSRLTHRAVTGRDCSWCAAAWEKHLEGRAAPLVYIFGKRHCRNSWQRYNGPI